MYRKRYIPNETVLLKDDVVISRSDTLILTKWDVLHPRKDIDHGISAYYIDKGFKVSKVFDKNHQLVYWYCDIIDTEYQPSADTYIFHDLLIDIVVYPDGSVKVVDLDEVADLLDSGDITSQIASNALKKANDLLSIIYNGNFHTLQSVINEL